MDDDREAFEFTYALYLAREVDWEAVQTIAAAAEAGIIGIEQAREALALLASRSNSKLNFDDQFF